MKFVCKNCNYRFESDIEQEDKPCPYCGKKELVSESDAQALINEEE